MSADKEAAKHALLQVLGIVFSSDEDGSKRVRFMGRMKRYLFQRKNPGWIAPLLMTKERHKRLKRIRAALDFVATEMDQDPHILSFVDDNHDSLGDGFMLLGELEQAGRLQNVIDVIDVAISDNPPSGRHIEKEFRYEFWRDLAFIYEDATGRVAGVSKSYRFADDANASREEVISGTFVEFVRCIHMYFDHSEPPPTVHQIDSFCDWYRDNKSDINVELARSHLMSVA